MKYKTIEMNMKRIVSIFAVLALSLGTMASAQQMPPIPVDPNVRIGQLENGLTYYIRHRPISTSRRKSAPSSRMSRSAVWPISWSTCASTVRSTSRATAW